jgi:integrase
MSPGGGSGGGKMAKQTNKLTARGVATMTEVGRHSDGGGLYFVVGPTGSRAWAFMWKRDGKRREMGLGPLSAVSLAEARQKAAECRKIVAEGGDPLIERDRANSSVSATPTFGEAADALIAAKVHEWQNAKHKAQWRMTLTEYAKPLRSKPVDKVTTADVLAVLKPVWLKKPETASRLRGRIEAVLDAAKAQGHRSGENPAAWRGHLSHLLPKRPKLSRGHHAAMPYDEVPGFIQQLRGRDGMAARALEFTILTAARTGEAIGARVAEIDLGKRVWTVPKERMKAGREHRVPLTARMVEILKEVELLRGESEMVFVGPRGRALSNMGMDAVLRRMGVEVTVHGFRSAFRDWAGNETQFQREVAEAALAHVVGDKAEQAYRRGDALEKRRALMEAWGNYCEGQGAAGNVVAFRGVN